MTRPLRMAVVGGGWVTVNRHLPSLDRHPDVELVGMVAPKATLDQTRRMGVAERFALDRLGSSLEEEWITSLDAVVIGTPPDTHTDLVCDALDRGLHVLVEKPFALTTADCDRMIERGRAADRRIGLVHNLRFGRAATRARRALEDGRIGDLRMVFGVQSSNHKRRLPTWYKDLPLGLFTDEAPHLVYLLQSFLPGAAIETLHVGPPLAPDDNTPDLLTAVVRDGNGVPGSLQMAFAGAISEWLLVLMGSRGTILVDFFRDTFVLLPDDGSHLLGDVLRTQAFAVAEHLAGTLSSGAQRVRGHLDYGNDEVIRRFVEAVRSGSEPEGMGATEGRAVVAVLQAAHLARAAQAGAGRRADTAPA